MQPSLPTPHDVPGESSITPPIIAQDGSTTSVPPRPASPNVNPAMAADEDVIEKEWVQRLKQIIATTKHDPFLQEHEISKLQADYLMKRYGKQVRIPVDE